MRLPGVLALTLAVLALGCGNRSPQARQPLTVAAAANLTAVFGTVGHGFERETGIPVTFSFGSTAQLSQQIEHGAPFDFFAAADTAHVDALVKSGHIRADSRAVYARGELVVWIPRGGVKTMPELTRRDIRYIAIAKPELAPYGRASVEALRAAKLWSAVEPKAVYATSINMARQLAASGNADAAFVAYSLVLSEKGAILRVDPALYQPIEQAAGVVALSRNAAAANRFREYLLGPRGRAILAGGGYEVPPASSRLQ